MTKNPRRAGEWTAREIEADGVGYVAAQKAEREDRADAETNELLALKRWGMLTAENLGHARLIGHGLPIKDDVA